VDDRLWPARNVAEHKFCPRLFYLMEVEGLHLHNSETLQGQLVHRKVDQPSKEKTTATAQDKDIPKSLRSLTLTSTLYSLTATLDLAKIDGNVATPIEYRKGRPQRKNSSNVPFEGPQPWPTDKVQLGLQALLLEEAGYTILILSVYYAQEKLYLEFPFDDQIRQEALACLEDAKRTATGSRPLPLVNDPKCVGCSMQPVCLPDEVNFQLGVEQSPRKIWPPLDEGIQVFVQTKDLKIGIRGECLHITSGSYSSAEVETKAIPIANIESVSVFGYVQVTTQAIHALTRAGIPIAFISSAGGLLGLIEPFQSISSKLRIGQVQVAQDSRLSLELSKKLVSSKIINQRTILQRNHSSLPETVMAELSQLELASKDVDAAPSLLGLEGRAAAIYFQFFGDILKKEFGELFRENGRKRRPPPDPVNSLLSFAYTILSKECYSALKIAGLEPSIGVYHKSSPGRPALALDLMEPFRPLIADSVVISLINRGELGLGHFLKTVSGYQLTDHGRKIFFNAYSRRMDTNITHPVFGYKLSYRRMLILHARMIASWMLNEFDSLAFLTTR